MWIFLSKRKKLYFDALSKNWIFKETREKVWSFNDVIRIGLVKFHKCNEIRHLPN